MVAALASLLAAWQLVTGALEVADPSHGTISLAWRGCRVELREHGCMVKAGDELVVWTRPRPAAALPTDCETNLSRDLGGAGYTRIASGAEDGGCWARLAVQDPSGRVQLRGRDGAVVWTLAFTSLPAEDQELAGIRQLFETGDQEAAGRLLRPTVARLRGDDEGGSNLALALDLAQKLAFRARRFDEALALASEARAHYEALGWRSSVCDLAAALVVRHWFARGDRAAAERSLRDVARCAVESPRYAILYRLYHSDIHDGDADPFQLWVSHRGLDVFARRLRDVDAEAGILGSQHVLADRLGQHEEVARIEARLRQLQSEPATLHTCGLVTALSNVGWSIFLRNERGASQEDPRPLIEFALQAYTGNSPCRDTSSARNAALNLALAELHHGDPRRVEALLLPLQAADLGPEQALWRHVALARAGLRLGNVKLATHHVGRLAALAAEYADPTFEWHAAVARGQLHEALAAPVEAIAAYEAAEAARDELALPLALGAGRERAEALWAESARRLVELRRAEGPAGIDRAMNLARMSRRRAIRAVEALNTMPAEQRRRLADTILRTRATIDTDAALDDQRSGGELERAHERRRRQRQALRRQFDALLAGPAPTADELRPPADGELLLVYHSVGDRWVGFAADAIGVIDADLEFEADIDDDNLAEVLLAPFAASIERARSIRIVAAGALLKRDLHGLPFRGRPLLAHAPVVYSLDLSGPAPASRPLVRGTVVAANPGGDVSRLRHVDGERQVVMEQWSRLGLTTTALVSEAAVRSGVLDVLGRADIFHFAGHHLQAREARSSTDAWDHELRLERGTSLGVEDVLSSPTVPRVVVLSACRTALVDPLAASGGLAIGHGFLVRGAELVIATARPIDDAAGAEFVATLYAQAADAAALSDPATLAVTQRTLLGEARCEDLRDVCAYRAWTR